MTEITMKIVREKFSQYDDLSDQQLADALHQKFYADMPVADFYGRIGFAPQDAPEDFARQAQDLAIPAPPADPRRAPAAPPAPAMLQPFAAPQSPPPPPPSDVPPEAMTQMLTQMLAPQAGPAPGAPGPVPPAPGRVGQPGAMSPQALPPGVREPSRNMPEPGWMADKLGGAGVLVDILQGKTPVHPPVQPPSNAGAAPVQPLSDLGKRAARGLTEVGAAVPEALAVVGGGNPNASALMAQEEVTKAQEQIAAAQARLRDNPQMGNEDRKRITGVITDSQKIIESYQPLVDVAEGPLRPDAQDRPIYKKGQAIRDASLELFGTPDPQFDDRFLGKLAEGGGNMAGFIGVTLLTGPLGGAASGSALNTAGMYRRAKQDGASEAEARTAAYIGSIVGASEVVPIARAFDMIPSKLRGKVANALGKRLGNIFATAGEEGVQEALAEIANNLTEKGVWNEEQQVFEGAGESFLIGAILGGGMGAIAGPSSGDGPLAQQRVVREPSPTAPEEPRPEARTVEPMAPNAGVPPLDAAAPYVLTPQQQVKPEAQAAPEAPQGQPPGDAAAALTAALTPPQPAAAPPAEGQNVEIMDEVETREVTVVDEGSGRPSETPAQPQPPEAPVVGTDDAPAADGAEEGQPLAIDQIKPGEAVSVSLSGGPSIHATVSDVRRDGVLIREADGTQTLVPIEDIEDGFSTISHAQGDAETQPPTQEPPSEDQKVNPGEATPIRTQTLTSEEVGRVETDAKTFQYKDNGDEAGVTDRLQGVEDWDERSAMGGIVYEYKDGRRVVADGHQRLGLAKRLQEKGKQTPWNVEVIREADGFTPADVRRLAALKNIREGSGTAIDAAKVLREGPDEIDGLNLPPRSALVRDAKGLSRLSDDAFGMVVNEVVSPEWGAVVGENVADPALHADVVSLLKKLQPKNNAQAAMIAQQAGQETVTETQTSLFGQEGNVLNSEANAARVEADSTAAAYLAAEANRKGPISDALTAAARDFKANPKQGARIVRDFLSTIRDGETGGPVDEGVRPDRGSDDPQGTADEGGVRQDARQEEVAPAGDSLFGDLPKQEAKPDTSEMEAIKNQSKIRKLDGNTGDAGPLFDDQTDMLDQAESQEASQKVDAAGTFVDRAGGEKDNADFTDRRDELPDRIPVDQLGAEARRLTLEPGRERGVEHLMMIDGEGRIVAYGSGSENGTGVPGALPVLAERGSEDIIAHHNHPSSSAFSPPDYGIALMPGMRGVYIHGHDGGLLWASSTEKGRALMKANGIGPLTSRLQTIDRNAWKAARPAWLRLDESGEYDIGADINAPWREYSFAMFRAMDEVGLINGKIVSHPTREGGDKENPYFQDADLKRVYAKVVSALRELINKSDTENVTDDRIPTPHRHPGRVEKAPGVSDAGREERDGSIQGPVPGGNPAREEGDRGEESRDGAGQTVDPDFDGALDDMFGAEAKSSPDQAESSQSKPTDPVPAAKAEIAKSMQAKLRGLKEGSATFTDTQAFRNWFGDSKVVDENGEPLVVYHGSNEANIEEFDGLELPGWFAESGGPNPLVDRYGDQKYAVHLSVENPVRVPGDMNHTASVSEVLGQLDWPVSEWPGGDNVRQIDTMWSVVNRADFAEMAKKRGHDGIRVVEDGVVTWAVFDSTQIKSVNNRGTFDPNDPRILYREGEAAGEAITAAMPALRAELDRLNLKRVALAADTRRDRQGAFRANGDRLEILIGPALDPEATLHHEAIHAMRAMNLFTPREWRALEVKAAKAWVEQYDIPARYPDLLRHEQIEEAIAEAFADAVKGKKAPGGVMTQAFNKIGRILRALANALRGAGFQTAEDVFGRAMSGEVGARDPGSTGIVAMQKEARNAGGGFSPAAIEEARALNNLYGGAPIPNQLPLPPSFTAPERSGIDYVQELFQDRFIMFRAAEAAIEQQVGAAIPESMSFSLKETLFNGRTASRLDRLMREEVRPITDALKAEKIDLDDMGMYLIARHAKERNAVMKKRDPERFGSGGGSGLTDEAAEQVLSNFKEKGVTKKLERVASLIDTLLRRDLSTRRAAGLLSEEQYQDYRNMYQNYVPLRGYAERDDGGQVGRTGSGFDIRGKEVKPATGRSTLSDNPVVQAIAMRQEGIVRAEKNRAGRSLMRLAQKHPNPDIWEPMGKLPSRKVLDPDTGMVKKVVDFGAVREDEVLAVKIDGDTKYLRIKDPLMAASVKNLELRQVGIMARVVNTVSRATRAWSRLQTGANPDFVFPNGMSDFLEGVWTAYNVKDTKKMMRSYVRYYPVALYQGIKAEFHDSAVGRKVTGASKKAIQRLSKNDLSDAQIGKFEEYQKEWESAGGKINFMAFRDLDEITRDLNKEIESAGRRWWQITPWQAIEDMVAVIEKVNQPVESAGRLAMYVAARENGLSREKAAALSLDASGNYYRRGRATRGLAAFYAFFNPAVQGVEKFVRFSKQPRNWAVLGGVITSAYMLALFNMKFWEDDDDPEGRPLYLEIPAWERSRSLIIPYGIREVTIGDKKVKRLKYHSIRVPHNLRPLLTLGDQMAALTHAGSLPEGVPKHTEAGDVSREVTRSILMNNNPLGSETPWNAVAPTVLDPFVDITLNRTWSGSPVRPMDYPWTEGLPKSSQYFERSTSPAAVTIAQALNRASGGNRFEPGAFDTYPDNIEHLFNYMTGGVGRFISRSGEAALNMAQGVETETSRTPILRSFSGETSHYAENDRYYEIRNQEFENRNRLRAAYKALQGNPEDEEAYDAVVSLMREMNVGLNGDTFSWGASTAKIFDKTDEALKSLREQILQVMNNEALSRPERIKRRNELRLEIEQMQLRARSAYVDLVTSIAEASGMD